MHKAGIWRVIWIWLGAVAVTVRVGLCGIIGALMSNGQGICVPSVTVI